MSLVGLALRNLAGSAFRSTMVALCVLVVAGFSLGTTAVVRGAERNLQLGMARLGADIVVVPEGEVVDAEAALLMGKPTASLLPASHLAKVAAVPGVAAASPQLFLSALANQPGSSAAETYLVAFDPATDFTILPWLSGGAGQQLERGEAIGGAQVDQPADGGSLVVDGHSLRLRANLQPTGVGIDRSLFVSFDTAGELTNAMAAGGQPPLAFDPDAISAIMVKLEPGVDPMAVALQIVQEIPGAAPVQRPELYRTLGRQLAGLQSGLLALMAIIWTLSIVFIGLVFSMAANERRHEIGVLRALGATRGFVFRSLLAEALLLALAGGLAGSLLAGLGIYLLAGPIAVALAVPFLAPPPAELLALGSGALALALLIVTLAALLPAHRISQQDPALAMRK